MNDAILSMSDHLNICVSWANSNAQSECTYGREIVGYIGEVTATLGTKELPEKLSDDEIAQMLLGFLSIESANLYEISKKD